MEDSGIGKLVFLLFVIVAATLIEAAIGCALWGAIMVKVFALPALTYWQFFGLIILVRILLPDNSISRLRKGDD